MTDLSPADVEVLTFERGWWKHPSAKEAEIRDRFGCSATVYYQRLGVLIDRPEAYLHDPPLVKRLRALRDQRRARRAG